VRVGISGRVIDHQVGGNSRYARGLLEHAPKVGIDYVTLRPRLAIRTGPPGLRYFLSESAWSHTISASSDLELVHYPADTGPLTSGIIPAITTVHGVASEHVAHVRSRYMESAWRLRVGRAIASSERLITVSRSSADDIVRLFGFPARKLDVIYHGISSRFSPEGGTDTTLVRYGLPEEYCLYVGNLDPRKNVHALIAAFSQHSLISRNMHLVIVARGGWDFGDVLQQIADSPHVTHLNDVDDDDLVPLIRRAKLFAFPSLYEGFGFPVLEAMACGVPVVTSDRGALAEITGDAARIVDPEDVSSIAQGLVSVWDDELAQVEMRERGLINAARFTWSNCLMQHRESYVQAVHGRG
jgi:glycosyltransferase involved in cell wall biosynthesis